jgi:Zn-dependent protease with chaperone function
MRWTWFLAPVALTSLCTAAVLVAGTLPAVAVILWLGPLLPLVLLAAVEGLPRLLMIEDAIPAPPRTVWVLVTAAAVGLAAGNALTGRPILAWRTQLFAFGTRELAVFASLTTTGVVVLARTAARTVTGTVDDAADGTVEPLDLWPETEPPRPIAGLDVRRVDADEPAVWTIDDGRDATVYVTAGALDVLDREQQRAVVARETAAILEATRTVAFWTTGVVAVLDRLRTIDSTNPIFLFFLIYLFSVFRPLVATNRALRQWHQRRTVVDCDEGGALIAEDADGLATALRTLEHARSDRPTPLTSALEPLTAVPTDAVDLETRLDALAAVQQRLDDRTANQSTATNP